MKTLLAGNAEYTLCDHINRYCFSGHSQPLEPLRSSFTGQSKLYKLERRKEGCKSSQNIENRIGV